MIKATDLMIGDWVYSEYLKTNARVQTMTQDYIEVCPCSSVCDPRNPYESVRPIPLTAEILEKNEWAQVRNKDDANGSMETWFMPGVGYAYHFTRGYEFEIISYGLNNHGNAKYRGTLEYIHQLQNTFSICGLNELAENFRID